MNDFLSPQPSRRSAFTLVEIMVSMAILGFLLILLVSMTDSTRRTWQYTTGKIEQFRDAREAFESISRNLSQATLNTYWDYDDPAKPTRYIRQSELRFISGSAEALLGGSQHPSHAIFYQAPLGYVEAPASDGLENLLNSRGYFIEYGDDADLRPGFLDGLSPRPELRSRFRLMEFMEPSETMGLYKFTNGNPTYAGREWFTAPLSSSPKPTRVLAENVIALIIYPKLTPREDPTGSALAPAYEYDSTSNGEGTTAAKSNLNTRNQLPPLVQLTLVAIDETSARRLTQADNADIQAKVATLFSNAANYRKDLILDPSDGSESLEEYLVTKRIAYRVFTTNVSIRGAKWSREQFN